jgi:hypothetical protein
VILNFLIFIHIVSCLIAIGAGTKVLIGLFAGILNEKWAVAYLRSALTASVTGILFPFHHLQPMHFVAMSSVYVTGAAILAWRKFHLAGVWSSICAFSITIVLCLNILFVTSQAFMHIPALNAMAPTQSEPAFVLSQCAVLILFTVLGAVAALRFRNQPNHFS